jgi:hypothetical protein
MQNPYDLWFIGLGLSEVVRGLQILLGSSTSKKFIQIINGRTPPKVSPLRERRAQEGRDPAWFTSLDFHVGKFD